MKQNGEKLSLKEKLGFMSFSGASNIVYNLRGTFYLVFLRSVLQMDWAIAGYIYALGCIWDAINDPLIASFSANRKFKNGESIRPYALWACIPFVLSTLFIFTNFNVNATWTVIIAAIGYFIFNITFTFFNIPYNGLASLATSDDKERSSINAFRGLGSCIGSALGTAAFIPIVHLFGGLDNNRTKWGPQDSSAFFWAVFVLGIIVIAGSLFHYFTSKERIRDEKINNEKIGTIEQYKILTKSKSWILNVLYIVCYTVSTTLVMNYINFYCENNLGNPDKATPILAAYLIMAIITAVLTPILINKMGRKKTAIIPLVIMGLGKLPFIFFPNEITCIIVAITCGIGLTSTFVLLNDNRNTIADIIAEKNGRRLDAIVAGGDGLIDKISQALTLFGTTQLLSYMDEANQMLSYEAFIGWVPFIVGLIAILIAVLLNPEKELEKVRNKKND